MSKGKLFLILWLVAAAFIPSNGQRTPNVNAFARDAVNETRRTVTLPNVEGSLKFAAVGDTGRGTRVQYELGAMMAAYQEKFNYDTIILTGDNMY